MCYHISMKKWDGKITSKCVLCDREFEPSDIEPGGFITETHSKAQIIDCYALDHNKLCEHCKDKRPEQVIKELKNSGRM